MKSCIVIMGNGDLKYMARFLDINTGRGACMFGNTRMEAINKVLRIIFR